MFDTFWHGWIADPNGRLPSNLLPAMASQHRNGRGLRGFGFASTFRWAHVTLSTLLEMLGNERLEEGGNKQNQTEFKQIRSPSIKKLTRHWGLVLFHMYARWPILTTLTSGVSIIVEQLRIISLFWNWTRKTHSWRISTSIFTRPGIALDIEAQTQLLDWTVLSCQNFLKCQSWSWTK